MEYQSMHPIWLLVMIVMQCLYFEMCCQNAEHTHTHTHWW